MWKRSILAALPRIMHSKDREGAGLIRRSLLTFASIALTIVVAACTPEDGFRNYANTVGPDLYSTRTVKNTRLLASYTANICRQAGLLRDEYDNCAIASSADWKRFVDMGLYDIDQRCDSFLDSLYYKDKTSGSIITQIADTRSATGAILAATATSSRALSIVAAAFDLAENSFRNVNTTLLQALDPTTVKSIVFRRQQDVKAQIYASTISDKPQALHALRTYLRVCMPFTIEMEANAILTTVQRTNTQGDSPIVFAAEQRTAESVVKRTERPRLEKITNSADLVALVGENSGRTPDAVNNVQMKLCVSPNGKVDAKTRTAVTLYRQQKKVSDTIWRPLSEDEAKEILGPRVGLCQTKYFLNYYESANLSTEKGFKDFMTAFNSKANDTEKLLETDSLSADPKSGFRSKIMALKKRKPDLAGTATEDGNPGHITPQFFAMLLKEEA